MSSSSPLRRTLSASRSSPAKLNGSTRSNGHPTSSTLEQQMEFSRLLVADARAFAATLDQVTAEQQQRHIDALDRALAKHAEVRASAERARERVELELERQYRRREEEERRAVEKARYALEEQRLAEDERRVAEMKRREDDRKRAEALAKEEREAKARLEAERQKVDDERLRRQAIRDKEEADRKANADEVAKQHAQTAEQTRHVQLQPAPPRRPASAVNGVSAPVTKLAADTTSPPGVPPQLVTSLDQLDTIHARYLDLHQRLKKMRQQVTEQCKHNHALKEQVGDWRRAIKKCVGQLGKAQTKETRDGNRKSLLEITTILDNAAQVSEPSINITDYLVENHQPADAATYGPAVLLLLLNYFVKYVMSQMTAESGVDSKTADPLGVMVVTVFARPQYLFNGQSLIDVLWAKYHKACPALFGITGSETSTAGRLRIGWAFDQDAEAFVEAKEHFDRMAGLGAGFAAITLRDFSRSKNKNPAPNRLYWQAVARILNTSDPGTTQCILLKALIQSFVPRILAAFGSAGVSLIQTACRTFPETKGPRTERGGKSSAVLALETLPAALQQDIALTL